MTLGRTSSGAIKIKTDGEAGLRAVECACCAPPCSSCGQIEITDSTLKEILKNATTATCNGQSRSWGGSAMWFFPNGEIITAGFDGRCFGMKVNNEDFGVNEAYDQYERISEFAPGESSTCCGTDQVEDGPPEICSGGNCYCWKRSRHSCSAANFSINGISFPGYFSRVVSVSVLPQCWDSDIPTEPNDYPSPPDLLPLVNLPSFVFS